jgi:hypothetical protein
MHRSSSSTLIDDFGVVEIDLNPSLIFLLHCVDAPHHRYEPNHMYEHERHRD